MDKTNETTSRSEAENDVIALGIASIETQGGGGVQNEELGRMIGFGISEE
jgi:hypothetical protein